mmetsp:Transcript_34921/g.96438  ORF Transcript_34921/g.96438 Transcript_34921/m.96438 type:complete len:274 (+) Transcript_34921:1088-1909(+)
MGSGVHQAVVLQAAEALARDHMDGAHRKRGSPSQRHPTPPHQGEERRRLPPGRAERRRQAPSRAPQADVLHYLCFCRQQISCGESAPFFRRRKPAALCQERRHSPATRRWTRATTPCACCLQCHPPRFPPRHPLCATRGTRVGRGSCVAPTRQLVSSLGARRHRAGVCRWRRLRRVAECGGGPTTGRCVSTLSCRRPPPRRRRRRCRRRQPASCRQGLPMVRPRRPCSSLASPPARARPQRDLRHFFRTLTAWLPGDGAQLRPSSSSRAWIDH